MINTRSNLLTIVIATYNRLGKLKKVLESISQGTRISHEIIVADGGSTDGTIEYLSTLPNITKKLQSGLLGVSKSYNMVWKEIDSQYTCWLSDDTVITDGSLDMAVSILQGDPDIGMVGLKMKDVEGPEVDKPYKGGVSAYGILTCNHGVLPMKVIRSIGFFDETFRSYFVDTDLTAAVLSCGKKVVLTKKISVLHYRDQLSKQDLKKKISVYNQDVDVDTIYRQKYQYLSGSRTEEIVKREAFWKVMDFILQFNPARNIKLLGRNSRDWRNHFLCRYISRTDYKDNLNNPFYLVQQIRQEYLIMTNNPYRQLAGKI